MPKLALLTTLFALFTTSLFGHAVGEHYMYLEFHDDHIEGRIEFLVDDFREELGFDIFENGKASVPKMVQTAPQVHEYISKNFSMGPSPSQPYQLKFSDPTLFSPEGGWLQYNFRVDVENTPPELYITDTMIFDDDPLHRGILVIEEGDWPAEGYTMLISMVFRKSLPTQVLDVRNPQEVMNGIDMIWQGILHIWIGIDHILFLLSLALPVVLLRQNHKWEPVNSLGGSLWPLLKIVTVFTIAHSITLLLAGLDVINVPSRLVESIIALSIVLVALTNIFGKSHKTSLWIILVLGLFHGLGFASVMGDLPLRIAEFKSFFVSVVAFNFGVELGQLAILLVLFPILFTLRKSSLYVPAVLKGGSVVLVLIAGYWFVERAFAL